MKAPDVGLSTRYVLSQSDLFVMRYRRSKDNSLELAVHLNADESVDTANRLFPSKATPAHSQRPISPAAKQDSFIQRSAVRVQRGRQKYRQQKEKERVIVAPFPFPAP
jgi:hypothetical protein